MIFPKLTVNLTAQKLQLLCMLVYTGKSFPNFRARLRHNTDKNIPFCKLRIFRSACRFGNLFRFKYSLERKIFSGIVYCNTCSKCKFIHYGKTFGHVFTRACEHILRWHWTWQKNLLKTLKIWHHLTTCCNLTPLQILANLIFQHPMKLLIKESLLIKRDKSVLNRKIKSVPLHFWNRNLGFTFH